MRVLSEMMYGVQLWILKYVDLRRLCTSVRDYLTILLEQNLDSSHLATNSGVGVGWEKPKDRNNYGRHDTSVLRLFNT